MSYNTIFSLCSCFHALPSNNTASQNIGGDQCMGRPPHLEFLGGPSPPVPPRSPPLDLCVLCLIKRKQIILFPDVHVDKLLTLIFFFSSFLLSSLTFFLPSFIHL